MSFNWHGVPRYVREVDSGWTNTNSKLPFEVAYGPLRYMPKKTWTKFAWKQIQVWIYILPYFFWKVRIWIWEINIYKNINVYIYTYIYLIKKTINQKHRKFKFPNIFCSKLLSKTQKFTVLQNSDLCVLGWKRGCFIGKS